MPPKKKPNLQQQKTNKIARDLIKMKKRADEFRLSLMENQENIPPTDNIKENMDKMDIKNTLYNI